ncbi:MAG: glycosyltransferase family 2 protein [Chitinivibrionales bacterium]|nr:glycosyltransferase family 2 protein [Chitinivibrionales bacterium]
MSENLLSIIIPLYNEQDSLQPLFEKIIESLTNIGYSYEIIFIDDGSTDNSFSVLQNLYNKYPATVQVIRFTRNFGKSAALAAGISKAAGNIIVTMDADLQDDPVAIPEMLALLNQGWDVVSGWKKIRHDPLSKTFPSKIWNYMTSQMSGLRLHDFNCGFKMYRAIAAKSLDIYGEHHRYLPTLAHWNGFKVTEMVVPHHPRQFGKTKYGSFLRVFNGLFDLMTLLFLKRYISSPLHFFGSIGFFFFMLGSAVLGYFGIVWAIEGSMHIRPLTLLSLGSIILGIQFFSLGLLGEMITSTKSKNVYQIRDHLE